MELTNKIVLLTGASGGIGQALATLLEKKGARLVLVARNLEKLEALQGQLSSPQNHWCLDCDITSIDGLNKIDAFYQELKAQNMQIDCLINGAGWNQFKRFSDKNIEDIEREVVLNLIAPMKLTHHALNWPTPPQFFLNVGSTLGSIGFPGYGSYGATKSGLQRFSESLDRELASKNIRVLYAAPRATLTDLNSPQVLEMNKKLGAQIDTPEQVAEFIVKVLEDEKAASWLGWPEKLFAKVNQIFPKLVTKALKKNDPVFQAYMDK